MNKYTLGIDGMRCGMCETHVQRAIYNDIKTKKVKAFRFKKEVVVISEAELTVYDFEKALKNTGYIITSFKKEEAKKVFLFWR